MADGWHSCHTYSILKRVNDFFFLEHEEFGQLESCFLFSVGFFCASKYIPKILVFIFPKIQKKLTK